jgi:hypothetical protein
MVPSSDAVRFEMSIANPSGNSIFHGTWTLKVAAMALSLPTLAFGSALAFGSVRLSEGQDSAQSLLAAMCLAISIISLFCITQDPLDVTIDSEQVVIRYPGWKRTISFSDITSATLTDETTAKGNTCTVVVIDVKNRKPVKLYRIREGSVALTQALQNALAPNPAE